MNRIPTRLALFALTLIMAVVAVALAVPHLAMVHVAHVAQTAHSAMNPNSLVFTGLFAGVIGSLRTVSMDNDSFPARASVWQQFNQLALWTSYRNRNRLLSTTIATLPVCATATVTSKVKTTNATVVLNGGVANAVAGTDNAWTLTGANLVTGKSRKYLLLVDVNDAFTVQASDDQATAANCSFSQLPADGLAIAGVLTVANASGADFIPATTLLGAAGITATYIDDAGDDSCLPFGKLVPT